MRIISTRSFHFLPEDLFAMLRRRFAELGGLGLAALTLALLVALATWSVQDPSLNHATDARVQNWLGFPGAIAADFLMQLFGLAALAAILPFSVFGWQIVTHRDVYRLRFRFVAWVLGVAMSAGTAASIPATVNWPLPAGLGGVLGDALMRAPAFIFGEPLPFEIRLFFGIAFGVLALITLMLSCGIGVPEAEEFESDEEDEESAPRRRWISLGAIFHGFLAFKTRLSGRGSASLRAILREMFGRDYDEVPLVPRREPTLDGSGAELDEEEYEDDEEEEEPRASPRRKPLRTRRGRWEYPPLELLSAAPKATAPAISQAALDENARRLEGVLKDFGVQGEIVNVRPGPVVTLYELEPAPGIKSSRVIGLADDIARSMSAVSARVAVVPGRNAIGIELPNPRRDKVVLREMLSQPAFDRSEARLPLCLGKTIGGEPVIVDLARMPHLLIAGTTGSGKSVAINTMILSLL
jgi:S-DNA-T family DNA segregation ATPase FtsK/SpoIIIE